MSNPPNPLPGFGYVAPSGITGELNDLFLKRFLQTMVVGITGMNPAMVRPRWQPNPPNQPSFDTDWAAIGEVNTVPDAYASVAHSTDMDGNGIDTAARNEVMDILCSFYGPDAQANSKLLVNGLSVEQNRIAMTLNGFGLLSVGQEVQVPALIKERWVPGWDVPFRIRHLQIYTYPSPNLVSAEVGISTDSGFSDSVTVTE